MSEGDKNYELKVLQMVINEHLDQILAINQNYKLERTILAIETNLENLGIHSSQIAEQLTTAKKNLKNLEVNSDQIVWELATKIYTQSGHKVEFSTIRDVVNSRIDLLRSQVQVLSNVLTVVIERERVQAEKARKKEEEEARKKEEVIKNGIDIILETFEGDKAKTDVFLRVHEVLIDQSEQDIEIDQTTLDLHIRNDLGLDVLDAMELRMVLKEDFDIDISDHDEQELFGWYYPWGFSSSSHDYRGCTIRQLVNYIYQKVIS